MHRSKVASANRKCRPEGAAAAHRADREAVAVARVNQVVAPADVVADRAPAVRAGPPKRPPVQAFQPRPRPQQQGSDEQRELQRAFPSSAWPGQ